MIAPANHHGLKVAVGAAQLRDRIIRLADSDTPGSEECREFMFDQAQFAEGEAVAVVKQWLITADCIAYYNDATEWHHEYLGGRVWKVVAHFTDEVLSRWHVYEGTTAVDPVDNAFVGVC